MATTKPRITVTLTKRQHEVLKAIAETGGQSMSSLLGEFIEVALPTFERMAATFQQMKKASDQERVRIVAALDDAQSALEPIALAAAGQFDLFLGRVGAAAESGGSVAPRHEAPSARPAEPQRQSPPTNRGVTPSRGKSPQPSTANASKLVLKSEVSKKVGGK